MLPLSPRLRYLQRDATLKDNIDDGAEYCRQCQDNECPFERYVRDYPKGGGAHAHTLSRCSHPYLVRSPDVLLPESGTGRPNRWVHCQAMIWFGPEHGEAEVHALLRQVRLQ